MDGIPAEQKVDGILRAPGGFVYWSLLLMGFATFAPAILMPEYRTYQALLLREQWERERLERLEHSVNRERRMLEGLRGDPAVIARVAQRELGFRRTDDQWVNIQPAHASGSAMLAAQTGLIANPEAPIEVWDDHDEPQATASDQGVSALPPLIGSVVAALPPLPYDFLFVQEPTRSIMICLGMAAIGAAILLFGRRPYPLTEM